MTVCSVFNGCGHVQCSVCFWCGCVQSFFGGGGGKFNVTMCSGFCAFGLTVGTVFSLVRCALLLVNLE